MLVLSIVLACSLIVVSGLFAYTKIQANTLERKVELLLDEDMRAFIKHVESVMAGETLIESYEDDKLWMYSYIEGHYRSEVTSIESHFEIVDISFEGDAVKMQVAYDINYLGPSGSLVSYMGASSTSNVIWTLEKHDGQWVLVDNNDKP